MKRFKIHFFVIWICTLIATPNLWAFHSISEPLERWSGSNVTFFTNGADWGVVAVIKASNTWNNAGSAFRFSWGGSTTNNAVQDGVNVVTYEDMGPHGPLAETRRYVVYKPDGTGTITEDDMVFNIYYQWTDDPITNPTKYDVQNVATHEFGHWLRLIDLYEDIASHPENPELTMYFEIAPGEIKKRTLEPDDIAGIIFIYGR